MCSDEMLIILYIHLKNFLKHSLFIVIRHLFRGIQIDVIISAYLIRSNDPNTFARYYYTHCYLEHFPVTNIETQAYKIRKKLASSVCAYPNIWMNKISCSISSHLKAEITILAWLLTVLSRQKHISLRIIWNVHPFSNDVPRTIFHNHCL